MAISYTHVQILCELLKRGLLPQGGLILEIGEANYYGDFPAQDVFDFAGESCDPDDTFAVARLIYKAFFSPKKIIAIDAGGPTAHKYDLNEPAPISNLRCDVVYNHGTAEHVFNIAQVFRTIHETTKVGGLMIHEGPFTGWVDHGFYCLQPTLFWDLAKANSYAIEFAAVEHMGSRTWREVGSRDDLLEAKRRGELADNLMLLVVLRKTRDAPFVIPMQGVYSADASKSTIDAWKALR